MGGNTFNPNVGKTMICLILDRSGSMSGREKDVIGGVNTFIDEQKKLPEAASIAFVRFDTSGIERFRPMQELAKVGPLQPQEYVPSGGTPLLDAVGQTINALDRDWVTERPARAIVVIVTDGEERDSREFKKEQIKAMIKARQDSGMWAFVYLGASVDAFAEGAAMGVSMRNTAGFTNTAVGTKRAYAAMTESVSHMRTSGATFANNLGKDIGESDDAANAAKPVIPQAAAVPQAPTQPWTPPVSGAATAPVATWSPPA